MNQKNELGKGLRALLSSINTDPVSNAESVSSTAVNTVSHLPIEQIKPNKLQPRHAFEQELIDELANSIKTYGIIQPLTVRPLGKDEYQIISGERRYRAAIKAGLQVLPVYLRSANDNEMLELALVENIQREDLNPIEVAISYQRLCDECKYTQDELADRVGKKRSTISNYVRLLKLPLEIQTALKTKQLTMGHARVIAGVDDLLQQMQLFKDIQKKDLSVRDSERIVQMYNRSKSRRPAQESAKPVDSDLRNLEQRLSAFFGYKANIQRNTNGEGKIIIKFKDNRQLNDILDRIDE